MRFMSSSKFKDQQLQERLAKFLESQRETTYSKYEIMKYLIKLNLWEDFKTWISNMKYQDYWDVPNEFSEEDEMFQTALKAFQSKFQMTDDEITTMKEACRQ